VLFLFSKDAGSALVELDGEEHKYLFKIRRAKLGDKISLRDLKTPTDFIYTITHIDKKSAALNLVDSASLEDKTIETHIAWCMCEPKTIEKTLPFLNELGVSKISLIYCYRSQKNFKINSERVEKILINSSQQCGRALLPKIDIYDSLEEFLRANRDVVALDFSSKKLDSSIQERTFLIGPEGGFSQEDRDMFKKYSVKSVGLKGNVLRSETATIVVASMRLLAEN
jgi:16S rRNA (uracil1498-N3)-methyltransferase